MGRNITFIIATRDESPPVLLPDLDFPEAEASVDGHRRLISFQDDRSKAANAEVAGMAEEKPEGLAAKALSPFRRRDGVPGPRIEPRRPRRRKCGCQKN